MSRPRRVIKNKGVAVVEGTPAASLIKDVDRFFASKPRERMAGENIAQKRTLDPRAINTRSPIQRRPQSERTDEERRANLEAFDRLSEERKREMTTNTRQPTPKDTDQMNNSPNVSPEDNMMFIGGSKNFDERTGRVESGYRDSPKQGRRQSFENLSAEEQAEVTALREKQMEERKLRSGKPRKFKRPVTGTVVKKRERHGMPLPSKVKRNEAKEKAESRRARFFKRRRSAKEAERSQSEQKSTQGKFITTLGR